MKNLEAIILDAGNEMVALLVEGSVVTNAILMVEVIGPDGNKFLTAGTTDMSPWTALGMLEAEVMRAKSGVMHALYHGDEEGYDDEYPE